MRPRARAMEADLSRLRSQEGARREAEAETAARLAGLEAELSAERVAIEDGDRALREAVRIFHQLEGEIQRKEDRVDAEFIDDPIAGLARPNTKINAAAGLVFGALVGVIIIFILEWIESGVVRRSEDIERYLDIPVIGKIPAE